MHIFGFLMTRLICILSSVENVDMSTYHVVCLCVDCPYSQNGFTVHYHTVFYDTKVGLGGIQHQFHGVTFRVLCQSIANFVIKFVSIIGNVCFLK